MESIQKFQDLLKRLFQFETSDLDFGIYRILNYKREQIEKFIQEDLKNKVESSFAKHKDEKLTNINQRFEEAKQKVIQGLGTQAFTLTGELKEEFKDTPLGRDFLSIKAQIDEAETIDEIKLQVFNDLYNFFSRYYEEGDFVPQYRHSIKGHKYAIPYNGEEVKLYWANNEQYYTKTGLLFRDYTFKANEYKVIFRIVSAREELGSKKATKQRFFILDDENPQETEGKDLIIRFQYREFTEGEVRSYDVSGGSNTAKQEKINQKTYDEVLKKIKDIELKAPLAKDYKSEKPLLLYQISRFTAKNTKDYFIHKNLKKFLSEQLDYFIKAEVLDIETLEKERFLDKHITRAKVVREIGEDIIDFLSQIEDFQKKLWEKKKFVLKTDYVITTDHVPEEFYKEIWTDKDQKREWKDLGFEIPKTKEDLKKRILPIDTKYFSQEFKEKLLEKLTEMADLGDLLDGLLIKSENWQALDLLFARYHGNIKCIYIDPPFNSKTTEILYRNFYKHSSWLSLLENRINLSKEFLNSNSCFIAAIDENEQERFGLLLDNVFPESVKTCVTIVHNPRGIQGKNFSYCHEYVYFIYPSNEKQYIGTLPREKPSLRNLRDNGGQSLRTDAKNCFYPIFVKGNKIVKIGDVASDDFHPKEQSKFLKDGTIEVWPIDPQGIERKWRYSVEGIRRVLNLLRVKETRGTVQIHILKEDDRYRTVWTGARYDANEYGSKLLMNILGEQESDKFTFPKSLYNVKDCVNATTQNYKESIVLDFFAGSGTTAHAVMKLNKEDCGKRKYILVEMADYFDTVIIPRLKKICYSFNWKEGKPQDTDGISQFFKYQVLEQYEDTLDNIELTSNKQAELKFGDDYLLKYFLDYETRENPSLLNIDQLKNPFSYKLKVNLEEVGEPMDMVVDIPETFNYLLGLKVKKIKTREIATPSARNDKKRKYLFVIGEKEGKDIAIVWREYDDNWKENDFKEDKKFIIKELEPWSPHIVYVNGQSVLTPKLGEYNVEIRYIEPEFKNLMEA
ncbi:MAG: site-specific DNA-methyltransferase [Deltaproteobacteria bacterium]|nr:site-specific DNA-methyltransferase [Deltaproteobacteria bacterium]